MTHLPNINICMELFKEAYGFYPDGYSPPEESPPDGGPRMSRYYESQYPLNWHMPTSQYEKGWEGSTWTPVRYTPYRRISHFREHLNRLQFCQFVSIPTSVYKALEPYFKESPLSLSPSTYFDIKSILKRHHFSHYNEHIHHLISYFHRSYLKIDYQDFQKMCSLFRELELAYEHHSTFFQESSHRKNFVSYYLVVQFVLYLFHYHTPYIMPTLLDQVKRSHYYATLLTMFSHTTHYSSLLHHHFVLKKECQSCQTHQTYFDIDLLKLL